VKLVLALILALLLAACGGPKVVRVLKDEAYTATFYDTKCTDKNVLAIIQRIGVPAQIVERMRSGRVVFTDGQDERNFCYADNAGGESTFIVDDAGSLGNLQLPGKK
jgi:hypothetical protein